MQQHTNTPPCPHNDDEIDLRELWQKLVEGKWMIAITTMLATLVAVVYAQVATPIYEGKVSIEVGELVLNRVANSTTASDIQMISLDNPADLAVILQDKFEDKMHLNPNEFFKATFVKGTKNLVEVIALDPDKQQIQIILTEVASFVMQRHEAKAKLYQDVTVNPTQQIAPIAISEKPIKPKSNLIIAVAVVLGLILGVFGVLVRETFRKKDVE